MLHHRHWTIEDANAVRAWVAARVRRMREARDRVADDPTMASLPSAATVSGGAWPGRESAAATLELTFGFEELGRLDIVVRDLDTGLVDFPALRDGEEIYLCWLVDEPAVAHWHAIEAGFMGRQPL
jgi:Uncharacterized conserved protein (DUF2203)